MMCKKKWSKFPPPLKNVFSLYIWEEMPSDSLYPFLKKQIFTFQGNVFVFLPTKKKRLKVNRWQPYLSGRVLTSKLP